MDGRSSGRGRDGGRGRGGGRSRAAGQGGGRGRQGAGREAAQDTTAELGRRLGEVLDRLPATQASVLRHRMGLVDGQPHSLADTARALGLSVSETRDIDARAMAHIREAIPVEHLQRFLGGDAAGPRG